MEIIGKHLGDDGVTYECKEPYEVVDDFGNKATLYRRLYIRQEIFEGEKTQLSERIAEIDQKLDIIKSYKEDIDAGTIR